MSASKIIYKFDDYVVDISEKRLFHRGELVPLTPKPFDILAVLLDKRGELVEKDFLLDKVWPGTFVEESNLAQNISTLRKSLGQPPNGGNYIETMLRRGYRFVAPVEEIIASRDEFVFNRLVHKPGLSEENGIETAKSLSSVSTAGGSARSNIGAAARGNQLFNNRKFVLLIFCAAALLSVSGYGVYRWLGKGKTNLAATVFEKTQVSKIGSDSKSRLPGISPDGKYIAYASGDPGSQSLIVRQTATDSAVTILPPSGLDLQMIVFSPSGEYVFYTQKGDKTDISVLHQIPTLGGIPKKLLEDVDSPPAFSPDGQKFAFIRHIEQGGEDIVFTVNADGSNLQQLFSSKQTDFDFLTNGSIAWSPDGAKLLCAPGTSQGGATIETVIGEISVEDGRFKIFDSRKWDTIGPLAWLKDGSGFLMVANQPQQPSQVWKVAYPSGETSAVTNDLSNYSGLGISADGSTLITTKSSSLSSMLRYSPSTKETTQMRPENTNLEGARGFSKTPDGKLIFSRNDEKEINLWKTDENGKNARPLTSGGGRNYSPNVTPDGRYIVFNSSSSGNWRIWRMNADGKNPVQLTDSDGSNADVNPVLTPDGTSVLFFRQFVTDKHASILMKVPVEGGTAVNMSADSSQNSRTSPRISPDGGRLAFIDYHYPSFEKNIVVVRFEDNKIGNIENTFKCGTIDSFDWMPDGKSLIYLSNEGKPNLWRLSLDGTWQRPITDFKSGLIFSWRWDSNGKLLYIVRGVTNSDLVLVRNSASPKN